MPKHSAKCKMLGHKKAKLNLTKEGRNGLVLVNALDCFGKNGRNGDNCYLVKLFALIKSDSVKNEQLFDGAFCDSLDGGT